MPLKIKGIDTWTGQWFTENWVKCEYDAICRSIASATTTTVISSERLMDLSPEQVARMVSDFAVDDVEFLVLSKDKEKWINSMWRHSVFRNDFIGEYSDFHAQMNNTNMSIFKKKFGESYFVKEIFVNQLGWVEELGAFLGVKAEIPNENRGASMECCLMLQEIHNKVGTSAFREYFTLDVKQNFSEMFNKSSKNVVG